MTLGSMRLRIPIDPEIGSRQEDQEHDRQRRRHTARLLPTTGRSPGRALTGPPAYRVHAGRGGSQRSERRHANRAVRPMAGEMGAPQSAEVHTFRIRVVAAAVVTALAGVRCRWRIRLGGNGSGSVLWGGGVASFPLGHARTTCSCGRRQWMLRDAAVAMRRGTRTTRWSASRLTGSPMTGSGRTASYALPDGFNPLRIACHGGGIARRLGVSAWRRGLAQWPGRHAVAW